MSHNLETLPQYHFNRIDFVNAFRHIFTDDEIMKIEDNCWANRQIDNFILLHDEDEFYIIHKDSGTIINWYKHLGRTNTCNKESFNYNDLHEFLKLLKEDLFDT